MLEATVQRFWAPKAGNSDSEYEDAFESSVGFTETGIETPILSLAVTDGATDSIYSKRWAQSLARAYVERPFYFLRTPGEILRELGTGWRSECSPADHPWYVQHKLLDGSFAAMVGVTFHGTGRWRAFAVGDCCLFQVRDNAIITALPLNNPEEFSNSPMLVGTDAARNACFLTGKQIKWTKQHWEPGDQFFLMSDAFAQWFLACANSASDQVAVEEVCGIKGRSELDQFLEQARDGQSCRMRNDDVTLIRCVVR